MADKRRVAPHDAGARKGGPEPGRNHLLLGALLCFAAVRILGVVVLSIWSTTTGKSAEVLLSRRWDSLWYVRVTQWGYNFTLTAPDGRILSDRAFYPFFPWVEHAVSVATSVSLPTAGLMVSAMASLCAAAGVYEAVREATGERAAAFAVVLWAAVPVGIVQSMAYSEALFTALAAWTLVSAAKERWVAAGALAAAAALTRPVGVAVVLAVVVGACGQSLRSSRVSAQQQIRRLVGALIAVTGLVAYPIWVGRHGHDGVLGYMDVQRAWGVGFDGGVAFAVFLGRLLRGPGAIGGLLLIAGVAVVVGAYWRGFSLRLPLTVQVYAGTVVVLALGASGYFGSKPRLLLPAFSILIPPAVRLARARPRHSITLVAALAVSSALYGAFWLNGTGPP